MIDDKEINVEVANSLGIKGILFIDSNQLITDLEKLLAVNLSEC